jgi:hypothetical protein
MVGRAAVVASAFVLAVPVAGASPSDTTAVPLERIAPGQLAECERSGRLRPVCPRLLPKVRGSGASLYLEPDLDVFTVMRGAEQPARPERNRPPRMLHVDVIAGDLERFTSFRETTKATLRDGLLRRDRTKPVDLGRLLWAGRAGRLYLAPSWPRGGMLGNHLVFAWAELGRRYALSLHAWEPLTESARTLRAIADSIPSPEQTRRLERLSPVRYLALARGETTGRSPIPAQPFRPAYDVGVVVRHRADVELELRTPDGSLLNVTSTQSAACRVRMPYRLCYLRFARLREPGGTWTIVARKRSRPPTTVRVDVLFESR